MIIKIIKCCCKKSPSTETTKPSQRITPTNSRMQRSFKEAAKPYQKGSPKKPPAFSSSSNGLGSSGNVLGSSSDLVSSQSCQRNPCVANHVYQPYLDDLLRHAAQKLVFFNIPGLEKERPERINMAKNVPFSLAGHLRKAKSDSYAFKLPKNQQKQRRVVLPGGVCTELAEHKWKTLDSTHFSTVMPGHVVCWFISKQPKYTVINNP